jgi:uncharacterized protein
MKRVGSIICICVLVAAEFGLSELHAQTSGPEIVVAQDNRSVGGFFRRLFRPRNAAPPPSGPVFRVVPRAEPRAEPRRQSTRRSRPSRPASPAPTPREIATVEKSEDAKRVLVVGDFMARSLAKGLSVAYRENPDALVIESTSGSSGLVRSDYYDWPAKLPEIVEEQKPDAILVLIGANDRQAIQTDSGSQSVGTDGWRAAYAARAAALADAIKSTGKPALWVGLTPVQSSSMSRDYSAFNGIVREQLEAKGISFIEVWNGFADEEGKYVSVGPDVRGQSVQLRASDGLNFTQAGQRKLAYFVEQELQDIFGGAAPQVASADPAANVEPGETGPQIGPMVPLDALAVTGGDALATGAPSGGENGVDLASTIANRIAGEEAAPPGRADSYRWPPEPQRPPVQQNPTPQPAAAAAAAASR